MQPDQPLVIVRLKKPKGDVVFRSTTIPQLFEDLKALVPETVIYGLVPDGSGYSLQPVGVVTLDVKTLQPEDLLGQVGPQVEPPAPPPIQEEVPAPLEGIKAEYASQGIPDQAQFLFEGPIPTKTQQELLTERGLEVPPDAPKKRTRKAKPVPSETDDDIDDSKLPNPTGRGQVQITAFSNATPAEAEAASRQIFK